MADLSPETQQQLSRLRDMQRMQEHPGFKTIEAFYPGNSDLGPDLAALGEHEVRLATADANVRKAMENTSGYTAFREQEAAPEVYRAAQEEYAKHIARVHEGVEAAEEKIRTLKSPDAARIRQEVFPAYDAAVNHHNAQLASVYNPAADSPRKLVDILEGTQQGGTELKEYLANSQRIARLQNRPLGEVLNEHLRSGGFSEEQAKNTSELLTAYQRGQHEEVLSRLEASAPAPKTPKSTIQANVTPERARSQLRDIERLRDAERSGIPNQAFGHLEHSYPGDTSLREDLEKLNKLDGDLASANAGVRPESGYTPGHAAFEKQREVRKAYAEHVNDVHGRISQAEEAIRTAPGDYGNQVRQEVASGYDAIVRHHNTQLPGFFDPATASPRKLVNAFENTTEHTGLKEYVANSRKLAKLQNRPLGEVLAEHLQSAGFHPNQARMYGDVANAYEAGKHDEFLAKLEAQYGKSAGLPTLAERSKNVAERLAAGAAHSAPAAAPVVEEAGRFASRFKGKGGKIAAIVAGGAAATAATIAVVAGVHNWSERENNRRTSQDPSAGPDLGA